MIRKTLRLKDETGKWIEKEAKAHGLDQSEFIDLVATWPPPSQEGTKIVRSNGSPFIAEALELPNGLLKIERDDDGLPVAFVRSKEKDAWLPMNWKRLEALNVEVQGLKRDKLVKEVEKLAIGNAKATGRLPPGARNILEQSRDTAEPGEFEWLFCVNCKQMIQTPEDLDYHKAQKHMIREPDPIEIQEVWPGAPRSGSNAGRGVSVGKSWK